MQSKKQKVTIIFGGRSAEHEVSIRSARNIYAALDKKRYDIKLIGITKEGKFLILPSEAQLLENETIISESDNEIIASNSMSMQRAFINNPVILSELSSSDVVFPILHGPYGEDGTVQGMLKLMNIPFVGAGILGSAVGMDKDVMKRLLRDAGIPIAKFVALSKREYSLKNSDEQFAATVQGFLGFPLFVKPANLGSSIGVTKVHSSEEFQTAVNYAFQYDRKILLEEAIVGREVELAVLGNDDPIVSGVGEILPTHEFYDYDAKYTDENGTKLEIPANVDEAVVRQLQEIAKKTFTTLCCSGMARVDCFLMRDNRIYVNEINTIPGFTNISMYPKLWEESGIPYAELVDKLIQLAIEKFEEEKQLKADNK